jgi:hypothetical protein
MFQKQTYDIEEIVKKPMPQVEVTEFNKNNQSITMYRTHRSNVTDPYIFYIQAMMKLAPNLDIENFIKKDSVAKTLTKERFSEEIDRIISQLKESYTFTFEGDFIQAVEFTDEDSRTQFIIETTEEVIFFNWART